jgi:spermidine/putrescine transport system substrate-binding protein
MKAMKRLAALALILLMLCPLMVSCKGEESITLYVYNWGEYISDGSDGTLNVNEAFEEYCKRELGMNVKVNYSTFSSNEEMYAKIESGASQYDVIIPSDYTIQLMIEKGLLAPLNLEKIPNYEYIMDSFKGENVYYEPHDGNVYSVPYAYGMIGIIYNTDIVPEGHPTVGSWDLMWDETFRGDILQFNNSRDAFGTALYALGYDVNDATEAQWREALALLTKQKELVQGYVMDEIFNKMKSGSAAVAAYYAGDFLSMYEDNDSLAFFYPEEGTNIYVDAMCIPSNALHYDLALEYINFMCSEEIAIANAEYHYYATPNELVAGNSEYRKYMESVHPDAMGILYNEEANATATAYRNLTPEKRQMLNTLWEELKVESSIGSGIYILCGVILAALAALAIWRVLKKRRWAKLYD